MGWAVNAAEGRERGTEAILGNSAWATFIIMMDFDMLQLGRMLEELHLQVGGKWV